MCVCVCVCVYVRACDVYVYVCTDIYIGYECVSCVSARVSLSAGRRCPPFGGTS